MNITRGESGHWIVLHGGRRMGTYATEKEARQVADQGIRRMLKNRTDRLQRFLSLMDTHSVPAFCVSQEIKLIELALAEAEARWGNPSVANEEEPS